MTTNELLEKVGDIDDATQEIVSNARKAGRELNPNQQGIEEISSFLKSHNFF